MAEIDAVAPRLHLTPDVVQKLKRWNEREADTMTALWSGEVDTPDEYQGRRQRANALATALHRAEVKLLGLDAHNAFIALKMRARDGTLDRVDDRGQFPVPAGAAYEAPIVSTYHPAPVDTSEYAHLFTD